MKKEKKQLWLHIRISEAEQEIVDSLMQEFDVTHRGTAVKILLRKHGKKRRANRQ